MLPLIPSKVDSTRTPIEIVLRDDIGYRDQISFKDFYVKDLFTGFNKINFNVRLLSGLRGHSGFSSPPQRLMTSDFKGFSLPDFIHYIIFLS